MKRIKITELDTRKFIDLHANPMLICAGDEKKANTMTAGWGMIGTMWSVPTTMIAVRQSRYTKEFLDKEEYFSLCLFDENNAALGYLGRVSGREEDKVAKVGYNWGYIDGVPYIEESDAVIICRKSMNQYLGPDAIVNKTALERFYKQAYNLDDYHDLYFGEIISCFTK